MSDTLISEEQVKALLRSNPELTPERIYGREFMATWRARADDVDRLALKVEEERQELEKLRAEKAAPQPVKAEDKKGDDDKSRFTDPRRNPFILGSTAPQPEKPAKAKDPNEKYLNPETNPFIKKA